MLGKLGCLSMHRCYSQTEPDLLKYELNEFDIIKPSASALFLNRSNSFCQRLHQLNDWCLFPSFNNRPTNCECRLSAGCHVSRVLSDDIFLDHHLRRSQSKSSSGHGRRNSIIHISGVQRSSSEVTLCRKRATTRLCVMSSQNPPVEASSADSLKQTQSRGFIKIDCDDTALEDDDELYLEASSVCEQTDSVPRFSKHEDDDDEDDENDEATAAKKMVELNKMESCCSAQSPVKREAAHAAAKQQHSRSQWEASQPLQDECGIRSKPQLDKIFARSERFGPSSSNLATDFSRALLNNLLQRGKEASLEFETSHAGTFSNTHVDERNQQPTDASVEELATKIVQRINQVKESRCSYFQFNGIKCVFDKLIASSPNLSHHLQRLKDLYMQPSNEVTVADQATQNNSVLSHPDSLARLERLEEELKEQASLLYKLLAELENLKEQNHRLTENHNEGETLAEMNTYKNLLFGQETPIERYDTKK